MRLLSAFVQIGDRTGNFYMGIFICSLKGPDFKFTFPLQETHQPVHPQAAFPRYTARVLMHRYLP